MADAAVVTRRTPREEFATPSLHERLAGLRLLPRLMRLVWDTHRPYTAFMAALRVVQAAVPLATFWIARSIVDLTVTLVRTGQTDRRLWTLVAIEGAIVLVGDIASRASSLVESLLADLFAIRINIRIMEHAATLDLHQFEDPDFYDHLERARRGTDRWLSLLRQFFAIGQDGLTVISLALAVAVQWPWLVALLILTVVPSFVGETRFAALAYSLLFQWTPERRQLDYLKYVGASDKSAKEIQMFDLAPWLIGRYRALSARFYAENQRLAVRKVAASAGLNVVGTLGYYAAYAVVLRATVVGSITIGTFTFLAATFQRSRTTVQSLLVSASNVLEQCLYLSDLFAFFDMKPTITSKPRAAAAPRPIRRGFVFENVGFRYPDSPRWAVRHVNFTLHPGERVAFVGENGAGKTTLTKLIARLYDPTEGRILLDGVDLRDYDIRDLRRVIGVIFQDFVRYDMRFDENVGVGEVERVREYLEADGAQAVPTPEVIVGAAEKSLASGLLARFPLAYRQMLGRRFSNGIDLSGGEWQKVALARAYMRDAQLLILDEPTAALDARAEYDVFVRFNELMTGRMAVVISHRFSTVRMADRIIVMCDGEVVSQGSHDELVAIPGLYSELFSLQASGYR